MSLISEIYSEVETLRGLLSALMVNFPDLTPRLHPAVVKVDAVLNNPTEQAIHLLIEDMLDLDAYFTDILMILHKESDKNLIVSIRNAKDVVGVLMGPEERVSLN